MAVAATVHGPAPGNMHSRAVSAIDTDSRSPSATTRQEPPNGIPSNTDSSARSARTGLQNRSTATKRSSIISGPPPPQPVSRSRPTSCERPTRKESRSPTCRWLTSTSASTQHSQHATMPYSPGSPHPFGQNGKLFLSEPLVWPYPATRLVLSLRWPRKIGQLFKVYSTD